MNRTYLNLELGSPIIFTFGEDRVIPDLALLILLGALSGFVSGVTGSGSGLILTGTLVAVMSVQDATVTAAVIAVVLGATNLWSVRQHVSWSDVWPTLAASVPGVVTGVYLLARLDEQVLKVALVVIIVAGCVTALASPSKRKNEPRQWGWIAGGLSGLLNGALGTGGPPLVLLTLLRGWDKSRCKAYLSIMFLLMGMFRLALLLASGIAQRSVVATGGLLVLPVVLSWWFGVMVFSRISTRWFRYAGMLVLLGVAANVIAGLNSI